ncbi:hypothetical protein CEXT_622611 [Caerostris extrusa]|uniref:Uncharacterized protein n=1 Tax=Caerostris extrusa TaxID=172846 RepID=A0AAV4MWK8_CAEEX|nr:hypothetical protein CEXT_622611 [Caerostris extrusa]
MFRKATYSSDQRQLKPVPHCKVQTGRVRRQKRPRKFWKSRNYQKLLTSSAIKYPRPFLEMAASSEGFATSLLLLEILWMDFLDYKLIILISDTSRTFCSSCLLSLVLSFLNSSLILRDLQPPSFFLKSYGWTFWTTNLSCSSLIQAELSVRLVCRVSYRVFLILKIQCVSEGSYAA